MLKEKEYISALMLIAFFAMTILGISSASGSQYLHLVPTAFLISAIVLVVNNKYHNFDHYFFYGLIFILSFGIHLSLDFFNVSVLKPNYSNSFGIKLFNIPLVIPVLWFVIINSVNGVLRKFRLNTYLAAFIGAFLVLILDVFIEAQAIKFGFWSWVGDETPIANYIWWFSLSFGFILASFKIGIRNNTFMGTTIYVLLLLFFAASDAISF